MIARKSVLILITMLGATILGMVGLFFIFRYGMVYEYGVIAFAMAYVGLFSFLTNLGLSKAHVKHISEGKDLGSCIGTYIVIKLALIGIMVAVILGSIFVWKYIIGRGFESAEHEIVIYMMIGFYVMMELAHIATHTFSARMESAKEQLPAILNPAVKVPLVILVVVFSLGLYALAGAFLAGTAAFLLGAMILFKGYPIKKYDKKLLKSYSRFALPLIVSGAFGRMMRNIDKVMIQLFWSSVAVGYYFGVERIISVLLMVPIALNTLLFPKISAYHGKKEFKEIRDLLKISFRYISMIILPCIAILIVLSKPILNILSESAAEKASILLQIMALYTFFACLYRVYSNQNMGMGKTGLVAKIGVTTSLTNIFLNILFIPTSIFGVKLLGLGAKGAAFASLISIIIGFILYASISYKTARIKMPLNILKHIFSACFMGLSLYLIMGFLYPVGWYKVPWYELLGLCLIGMGIYLLVLYILAEFQKRDLNLFLKALNPKEMKNYVKSELKGKK